MAGRGPKLLLELGGKTLLERVASTFLAHQAVGEIVAVVPERLLERARAILVGLSNPDGVSVAVIAGGTTRSDSVRAGLGALSQPLPYVAVHDVARAFVSADLISRVLAAAQATGSAIPALPLRDTVKEVDAGRVVRTLPRDKLEGAQTPQIFTRAILARAHARATGEESDATDDARLVETLGEPVAVVRGDPSNVKVTEPSDVILLESQLRSGGAT